MKRFLAVLLTISLFIAAVPFTSIPAFADAGDDAFEHKMHLVMDYADRREEFETNEDSRSFLDDYDTEDLHSVSVKLLADVTTTRYPQFTYADVYIDLNGHTWTVESAKSDFETTKDITIVGGTMIFKNSPSRPISTFGGSIRMRNVVFRDTACGKYGLISCENGVEVSSNGAFQYKTKVLYGSMQLDNVRFENCSSASYGGCIYIGCVDSENLEINNCKFINCHSQYGGAVYTEGDGCEYDFVNCEFTGDYATTDGGAIYSESKNSSFHFTNCNAYRCHADDDGGFAAVCANYCNLNGASDKGSATLAERSNIVGCYTIDSGAVYCSGSGCEIKNFNFASNTSGASTHNFDTVKSINGNNWGAGVCMQNTNIKVKNCDFYDNYASRYGGAIYAGHSGSSIENCSFYGNACQDAYKSNDIYIDADQSIDVLNCLFQSNTNSVGGKALKTSNGNNLISLTNVFAGGSGTKTDPYIIKNAGQWKLFALKVISGETYSGKYIELADDISVSYVPIGYYNQRKAFKGNFDGKNHTVHYLDSSENWDRGLFSYCVDATVKNVNVTGSVTGTVTLAGICAAAENTTFDNCTNNADVSSINEKYVAGICAIAENCRFISCTNNGTIHSQTRTAGGIAAYCSGSDTEFIGCRNNGYVYTSTSVIAGGIAGDVLNNITIKRCTNNAKVEASVDSAGGIVGCLRKGINIISCVNTEKGNICTKKYAAGILGWTDSSGEQISITNCANYGQIYVSNQYYGGIVVNYNNNNMTVANCINANKKLAKVTNCGGIVAGDGKGTYQNCFCIEGTVTDSHATTLSEANCGDYLASKLNLYIDEAITVDNEDDFAMWSTNPDTGLATPDLQGVFKSHITGRGTETKPFIIRDVKGMKELANNISLGIDYKGKYIRLEESLLYTGSPIGSGSHPFNGIFDGNGMTVTAQISGGTDTGLFGSASGATIKNLHVAGYISGSNSTGGVAGYAGAGTVIDNCHVTAAIMGTDVNVGGVVGFSGNCTISNCRMDGPVTSSGWTSTGGIVGGADGNVKIINCVCTSTVTGSKAVGGIIGCALNYDPVIANCSSVGSTAEYKAGSGYEHGGIIGFVGDALNSLTIKYCYSKCLVGVKNTVGYFVGNNTKGAGLKLDYVSYMKAGNATANVSGLAATVGKVYTVSSMSLKSAPGVLTGYIEGKSESGIALTSWEKDSVGLIPASYVSVNPLYGIRGRGTKLSPYVISSKENLMEFSEEVCSGGTYAGKYVKVTADIDYAGCPQIGNSGHPFKGNFDGGGHNINVNINTGNSCSALFYEACGATIRNIRLSGSVTGTSCVAGIVGHAYSGAVIDNCYVNASITGEEENVGGIVGMMYDSTVSNCRVDSTVTGSSKRPPVDIAEGDYYIYSLLSNQHYALDISGGLGAVNEECANVHIWENGAANVFTITKDKDKGTYIIKSKITGLTLDVDAASRKNGTNIQQYWDNGTDAQRWIFEASGFVDRYFYIRNVAGQYMTVDGDYGGNGVNVHSWEYTGAINQQFCLVQIPKAKTEVEDGDYIIRSALNEKLAVEISGGKTSIGVWGANVWLWENGEAEVFTVTKDLTKGTYTIKSKVTGLVLDITDASKANGANIIQYPSHGGECQQWVFEPAGDGYYYIRSALGTYIDVAGMVNGAKPYNGVNVYAWTGTGGTNQKFKLDKVSTKTPESTIEVADGDYIIYSALDQKYAVEIAGGLGAVDQPGANVHLWENGEAEEFTITKDKSRGTYIIKSKITGYLLDVANGSKENGANISQWYDNGTDAQRWVFEPSDDGYYYIRCVSGRYMDATGMVDGARPYNGVNISSYEFTGGTNQKFKLMHLTQGSSCCTGGIVGWMHHSCKVVNCVKTGDIKGNICVGGIAGYAQFGDSVIANCACTGTITQRDRLGKGFGGIVGEISGDINSITLVSCFSNCTMPYYYVKGCGYICGDNGAQGNQFKCSDLYYIKTVTENVSDFDQGSGVIIPATRLWKSSTEQLRNQYGNIMTKDNFIAFEEGFNRLNEYVKKNRNLVDGIPLTEWTRDNFKMYPKSYDTSSLAASVISSQSLPLIIVIAAGVIAGGVGVAVLYKKKKKKTADTES